MKLLNACPPAQRLERWSQPGVRRAHASVVCALIRGAIERQVPNGPITGLRPGTRVLNFLYCDKSPRDTLSVVMLAPGLASSLFPLSILFSFFLPKLDSN